jgi:nucleoside-diphosphate-sugar epimerase
MRVFVTGATGFIGGVIVPDLIAAGHTVLGLSRAEAGARTLAAVGADVHRGELEDLDGLRLAASQCDAVIHAGFNHDFSRFAQSCEEDRLVIEAIGDVLDGTDKPFVVTAGIPAVAGRPATEDDPPVAGDSPRVSEQTAAALAASGVRASVVRLPQVHDRNKHGLASFLIEIARAKGVSAYVDDGQHRWSAVHRSDVARVYRLALERGVAGERFHAVGEEGVSLKEIAEVIGQGLGVPVASLPKTQAADHFGGLAFAVGTDLSASSMLTGQRLGWSPSSAIGFNDDVERSTAYVT